MNVKSIECIPFQCLLIDTSYPYFIIRGLGVTITLLLLSATILARWRRPVASVEALDPLHRAMRLVAYQRITTASEAASKYGALNCHFFCMRPHCLPG